MKKNINHGFTLVELMAIFLFLTLILAASTPVITQRVKQLPPRTHHGKYICYRDDNGALVEEFYNSSRRISQNNVSECKFNGPKNATMFKIELIGAGAGGYDLATVPQDENLLTSVFDYNVGDLEFSRRNGDNNTGMVVEPSDEQLRDILRDLQARILVFTGRAGDGQGATLRYQDPLEAVCYVNTNRYYEEYPEYVTEFAVNAQEQVIETMVNGAYVRYSNGYLKVRDRQNEFKASVRASGGYTNTVNDAVRTTRDVDIDSLKTLCWNHYLRYGKNGVDDLTLKTSTQDIQGGSAGNGKALQYLYLMPVNAYNPNRYRNGGIKAYLRQIKEGHRVGSAQYAVGSVAWRGALNRGQIPFNSRVLPQNVSSTNERHTFNIGEWGTGDWEEAANGGNCTSFAAIQTSDSGYVGNASNSEPGQGARIRYDSSTGHIFYEKGANGRDADGVGKFGTVSGTADLIDAPSQTPGFTYEVPSVTLTSNVHERVHIVGLGGSAGTYLAPEYQSVLNNCTIRVGAGGPVLHDINDKDSLENNLSTSISCNSGEYTSTAAGGSYIWSNSLPVVQGVGVEYAQDGTAVKFTYNPFNVGTFENGRLRGPAAYDTQVIEGQSSLFNPTSNVFTRYSNKANNTNRAWGSGGHGAGIVDRCTEPYGSYKMEASDPLGKTKRFGENLPAPSCLGDGSKREITHATPGTSGAVIISW